MKSKKIYYIIGAISILGIGYYLWNKNKTQQKSTKKSTDDEIDIYDKDTSVNVTQKRRIPVKIELKQQLSPISIPSVKKLTAQELEIQLQNKCGKKPKLKKNKRRYEQCRSDYTAKLKYEGLVAFDGTYESVVADSFYSSFESSWDINM